MKIKSILIVFALFVSCAFSSTLNYVVTSDVTHMGFAFAWESWLTEPGTIVVNGATYFDDRDGYGPAQDHKVHRVFVNSVSLSRNTTYVVTLNSGTTSQLFTVKTGASIADFPPPDDRSGYIGDEKWGQSGAPDVLLLMQIQRDNGDGTVTKSAYLTTICSIGTNWAADLTGFRNQDNSARFAYNTNRDSLVINFSRGDWPNTAGQLRLPLTAPTASICLTPNSFPAIDDYESGVLGAAPNGWIPTNGVSITVTNNASYGSQAMEIKAATSNTYYAGFASKFLDGANYLDWGQYRYLRFSVKNVGPIGTKIAVSIKDNDNADFVLDDVFAATLNLNIKGVWKTVYIPLTANVVLKKDPTSGGNGNLDLNQHVAGGQVYAGGSLVGFSLAGVTINAGVDVLIDEISLVSAIYPNNDFRVEDSNWDGIKDSIELAAGVTKSTIVADNDNDGLNNFVEFNLGTSLNLANSFPYVDNFEGHGYSWLAVDNINVTRVNTSDLTVLFGGQPVNGAYSLLVSGAPTSSYYAGFFNNYMQNDGTIDWNSSYKSIKFVVKNQGQIGDAIKVQVQASTNIGIDKWEFTQVINSVGSWQYFTVPLNMFTRSLDSNGDALMNLNANGDEARAKLLGFSVNSKTATGNISFYLDNIEVSTIPTSDDTDGDGLPNAWEIAFGLNPSSSATSNGTYGTPAGDGFSNLDKYFTGLSANVKYLFPKIISFDGTTNETLQGWEAINGLTMTQLASSIGLANTHSSGYFGGYFDKYIGNYLYDWSKYQYIKIDIKNNGPVGSKIGLKIIDNDFPTHAVLAGTDEFAIEITLTDKNLHSYYIPFAAMTIASQACVERIQNFKPVDPMYPGVAFIGLAVNTATADNGPVDVEISSIELTNTVYDTTDSNGDGIPDWWCRLYNISPTSTALLDGPMGDPDNDGIPNMIEYMDYTSPLVNNNTLDHGADGIPYNWKTMYGLNPTANLAAVDTDGDGIDNLHEYLIGSSPLVNNNLYPSHNMIPDFWQIAYTGTTNALNIPAGKDTDGDGVTDYNAYLQGKNPNTTLVQVGPGWNLLSVAYNGKIDALIAAINTQNYIIGAAQWNLNPTTYQYEWLDYRTGSGSGLAFTVIQNEAIYFESTGVFSFFPPAPPASVVTYNFIVGWNPMSRVLGASMTVAQLKNDVDPRPLGTEPHKLEAIAVYRGGAWNVYNFIAQTSTGPIKISLNDIVSKYAGYMLKFVSSVNWTPSK